MKYRWIVPDREGRADFEVIEYMVESGDRIYQYALRRAQELAGEMNVCSPSGERRDERTILANCFAGCIAERMIIFRLNTYAKEKHKNVRAVSTVYDKRRDTDQIDILVCHGENTEIPAVSIEVRSSYGAVQDNFRRYTEWFSIVGNYTSENKDRELVKDYYITVVYNFPQKEMYRKMVEGEPIQLQLAGGCSRDFLKNNGKIDNLRNKGARYMVIKPLIRAFPVNAVMDQIFEELVGM